MLVLVIALLAMLALLATTFLVSSRYDEVGTASSQISHQMEMLLSMLEGSIRQRLARDLWGGDAQHNNAEHWLDATHEAYDGPDDDHPWLNGICGELIDWEPPAAGPVDHVQYVVDDDGDWRTLSDTDAGGVQVRFALIIQDLGGLVNVNVARRPDPDLVGEAYEQDPDPDEPQRWPYTFWAWYARRGSPDIGYWWYPYKQRATAPNARPPYTYSNLFTGSEHHMRGGGPGAMADLGRLLGDADEAHNVDAYFRRPECFGRSFDIQDELDLRFPGTAAGGSPYPSLVEKLLPSLAGAPRRRLLTAIGRTVNWQRRREPILMHPYEWETAGIESLKGSTDESWFFLFDSLANDDLNKYYRTYRMGYRVSVQRGFTFSGMVPAWQFRVNDRMRGHRYGTTTPVVQSPPGTVPIGEWKRQWRDASGVLHEEWVRVAPPFQYDDVMTDFANKNHLVDNYQYADAPTMMTNLLANLLATAGVPHPGKNPDDADSYAPQRTAHKPSVKSDRVMAYRKFAGALHLNVADCQDSNGIPGMLFTKTDDEINMFSRYGQVAGCEDRPYITEVVMEFEIWPDYAIIYEQQYYSTYSLRVDRVDKDTSAEVRGLPAYWKTTDADRNTTEVTVTITHARRTPAAGTPWSGADAVARISDLRSRLNGLTDSHTIDVKFTKRTRVRNSSGTILSDTSENGEAIGIALAAAVKVIAVEVYNPHEQPVFIHNGGTDSFYGAPYFRYNCAVPQQRNAETGQRAVLNQHPRMEGSRINPMWTDLAGRSCILYIESRQAGDWKANYGLSLKQRTEPFNDGDIRYYPTTYPGIFTKPLPGDQCNLGNLRPHDGEILLTIQGKTATNSQHASWTEVAYVADAVRNHAEDADGNALPAPPMPASGAASDPANAGKCDPKGVADAFAAAATKINGGVRNPVVRLYRPLYMESRATQFMTVADHWMNGAQRATIAGRLGKREADEDDFTVPGGYTDDYRHVDARSPLISSVNQAFRFAADVSRVWRLTQPRMPYLESGWEYQWSVYEEEDGEPLRTVPTEVIDRQMRGTLKRIADLSGEKDLASREVRRLLQKAEARLRFSPYTPKTPAELAECSAWYDLLDAFTCGGAIRDNVDNNTDSIADEVIPHRHGGYHWDIYPPGLEDFEFTGVFYINDGSKEKCNWLREASNCMPLHGRINVNTAPREVLERCLIAPSQEAREKLGAAIFEERGGVAGRANDDYRPFKSLAELYTRVSVLNGDRSFGFDYYGFDGEDNHNGADRLPDMTGWYAEGDQRKSLDPRGTIDDLDERNYLWRVNSELIGLRSDTFAVYLRFQARRNANSRWKVLAERRVYSIWDRADCIWPPRRLDGKLHPDYVAPQRIGIQIFGH